MKIFTKAISLLCAFFLVLFVPVPGFAAVQTVDIPPDFIDEAELFIYDAILPFDDTYNLCKYSNYSLGAEIPAYISVDNTDELTKSPSSFYPIIADSQVIGILQVNELSDEQFAFAYSEDLSSEINATDENFAIICSGIYKNLVTEDEFESVYQVQATNAITFESPYAFSWPLSPSLPNNTRSIPDSYTLAVPLKKQSTPYSCWAACVASVAEYKTGTTYSCEDILNRTKIDTTATMSQTVSALEALGVSASESANYLGAAKLTQNISSNYPILGGFNYTVGNYRYGHMMVIRGYNSGSRYLYMIMMDPSSGSYISVSVTSDQDMSFTYMGYDWFLNEYSIVTG